MKSNHYTLGANREKITELLESTEVKLAERDEALEDMVLAMQKEMEELKGAKPDTLNP